MLEQKTLKLERTTSLKTLRRKEVDESLKEVKYMKNHEKVKLGYKIRRIEQVEIYNISWIQHKKSKIKPAEENAQKTIGKY